MIKLDSATTYIARSIVRLLNGDMDEFKHYTSMAMQEVESQNYNKKSICTIGEIVPVETRRKLQQMTA